MIPPQVISRPPPPQRMNPPPPSQVTNTIQPRVMNQSQLLNHPIMAMNQQPHPMMMNPRNYNLNPTLTSDYTKQPNSFCSKSNQSHWQGKKRPNRRMYNPPQLPGGGSGGGYKPPALNELQSQNRLKTRKFYPKKNHSNRYVPYAPRNTTSFIIRAKKSGGIAELVSPCPVTPAILPTPMFSPSREVLGDMAKEEWGVDGYGSMKGLIRLRSNGPYDDDDDESGSSESDVEEHVEVERRLDHDLSRFEMIYPSYGGGGYDYNNVLENRVDDQDSQIAQLEEENLTLKERLFLMEREFGDLRRRLVCLERRGMVAEEDANEEEVVENESESDDDDTGGSDARTSGEIKENNHVGTEEDICMQDAETMVKSNVDEDKDRVGLVSTEEVAGDQCKEA
ncbi:unnamed protein product [Cochlearia groenlandica]